MGYFTKRLYIDIPSETDVDPTPLRHCTNLSIFVVNDSRALLQLFQNCSSIRVIRCRAPVYWTLVPTHAYQSVETLSLSEEYWPSSLLNVIALPRLHTLEILPGKGYLNYDCLCDFQLPALRRAIFGSYNVSLDPFLQIHEEDILALDLRGHMAWYDRLTLNRILTRCKVVEEITIYVYMLNTISFGATAHPTLLRVGLCMTGRIWPDRSELDFLMSSTHLGFRRLFHMGNPKLNVVRLVDFMAQDFYEAEPWSRTHIEMWESWIDHCSSVGIRFEFDSGELVRIPPKLLVDDYSAVGGDGLEPHALPIAPMSPGASRQVPDAEKEGSGWTCW
jgi:hypothetical protein